MIKKPVLRSITLLLTLAICLAVVPLTAAALPTQTDQTEWEILRLTNRERIAAGLLPLSITEPLQKAADIRSKECHTSFSHTRPNGASCSTVLDENGIFWRSMGENIAAGQSGPAQVMQSWMNSEGHRKNILSDFVQVGVGYYTDNECAYRKHYTQLFTGGCQTEKIWVQGAAGVLHIQAGTDVDDWNLTLCVKCTCGTGYLPLTASLCTGYDKRANGAQQITVSFRGATTVFAVSKRFVDVPENAWYTDTVYQAVESGLFDGVSATAFAPEAAMTRGMLTTVLYRLHGATEAADDCTFSDVKSTDWFAPAVAWAQQNGIVDGIGGNRFAPNEPISRQDTLTILYRYAGLCGLDLSAEADLSVFSDRDQIGAWAQSAMAWAVGNSLIRGKTPDTLCPRDHIRRNEVATLMLRYQQLCNDRK